MLTHTTYLIKGRGETVTFHGRFDSDNWRQAFDYEKEHNVKLERLKTQMY